MSAKGNSRRSFLINSVGGLNAAWVAAHYHDILAAQEYAGKGSQPPALAVLTAAQAAEVEAMADQIIPTDSSPGAREARCLYFIDRALSTFDKAKQPAYVKGLQDLQAKTQQLYPDASKFSALTSPQQIKVLTEMEKTPFFNLVRTHTVIGFLSRPVHGGNHDKVGWQLIGYDDSLNHKPPFGYYDAAFLTPQSGQGGKR
jgi:gluconate 2-dehydrogenase gamma chain